MIHKYEISGMHCNGCIKKMEGSLAAISSIKNVRVTLTPPEATIEMLQHISTEELNKNLIAVGNYVLQEKMPAITTEATSLPSENKESLRPLFVIVGYLAGGVLLRSSISSDFSIHSLMTNFMGGFFVLFSLFKMIDVSGFADGYSTYDLVAKHSRAYALAYPFLELLLGISYLMSFAPFAINLVTLVLMIIGSMGVAKALMEKRTIQCACLGTALKLPMTKVTLLEDGLMGLMALLMLMS